MGIFEKSVVAAKIMKPFDSENPGNVLYDCMISLYPKYKSYLEKSKRAREYINSSNNSIR